jgi:flagellar motor protein MotB
MRTLEFLTVIVATSLSPAVPADEYDFAAPEDALRLLNEIRVALGGDVTGGGVSVELTLDRIRVTIGQLVGQRGVELVLNSDRGPALEHLVGALGEAEDWGIEVQGHCSTAPLSETMETVHDTHERFTEAQAVVVREVMTALMAERLGRETVLISVEGQGAEHPVATNSTALGQRQNDRIEILILPPGWPDMPRPVFPGEPQTD